MVNVEGLAVGLAVGIPALLIFGTGAVMWLRNQKKQKEEDLRDDNIDIGFDDNNSFKEFQEELHKSYKPQRKDISNNDTEKLAGTNNENSSSSNDSSSTHFAEPIQKSHQKTPSSYDFYESVIPIIQTQGSGMSSNGLTDGSTFLPPPSHDGHEGNMESSSSTTSLNGVIRNHSLDNLAKQLTSPTYFEKLPSRAGTVSVRKSNSFLGNNSSHDLVVNSLSNENAINENYVYDSSPVKTINSVRDSKSQRQSPQRSPLASKANGSHSNLHENDEKGRLANENSSVDSPFVDVPDQEEDHSDSDS